MHMQARQFVTRTVRGLSRQPRRVLEIGGRNINGSIRDLFPGSDYIASDLAPGPGIDVVAHGAAIDVPPVDCVICCEVLEHTPDGAAICANAHRLLADGGIFIVTAAGVGRAPHSATDGGPLPAGEYYGGVARDALACWLAPFQAVYLTEAPEVGDIYGYGVRR